MKSFAAPCQNAAPLSAPDALIAGRRQVFDVPVAHADESGLRVAGKLHWLYYGRDRQHRVGVRARRGMEAIEAQGILPNGLPSWRMTAGSPVGVHALCNAHLLRELTSLLETTSQTWNKRMIGLLPAANEANQ